jgi:hypothetical protein
VFNALDTHVWKLVYDWARFTHSNKSRGWVKVRYFGEFNPSRRDTWVFGSQETGWEQWLTATRKAFPSHAVVAWGAGTPDERVASRLIHTHCHRRTIGNGKDTALEGTPAQQCAGATRRDLLLHRAAQSRHPQRLHRSRPGTRPAHRLRTALQRNRSAVQMEVHPGRPRGPAGPDRATRTERVQLPTASPLRPPACRTDPPHNPEGLTARTTKEEATIPRRRQRPSSQIPMKAPPSRMLGRTR